jgi:hypothetical protein
MRRAAMTFRGAVAGMLLAAASAVALASWPAPAQAAGSAVPQFCIKRGGPRGPDDVALLCRWSDYQSCLQAAAELNGNCVANMDYKGAVSTAPAARERRR